MAIKEQAKPRLLIVGLDRLGLWTALYYHLQGYEITCFDPNQKRIDWLKKGLSLIRDPDFQTLFNVHRSAMTFRNDEKVFSDTYEAMIWTLPNHDSHRSTFNEVLTLMARQLRKRPRLLIFEVLTPGSAQMMERFLADHSAKGASVIVAPCFHQAGYEDDALFHPTRLIVGCQNDEDHLFMSMFWHRYVEAGLDIAYLTPSNAELTGYMWHSQQALSLAFLNEWSTIAQSLGGSVDELAYALLQSEAPLKASSHPRVSCEDPRRESVTRYLAQLMDQKGRTTPLLHATVQQLDQRLLDILHELKRDFDGSLKDRKIAVLGLSCGERLRDIHGSQAYEIMNMLLQEQAIVWAYDRFTSHDFRHTYKDLRSLKYGTNIKETVQGAEAIILLNDDPELQKYTNEEWQDGAGQAVRVYNYAFRYPVQFPNPKE